ncbi:HD domain-containing protein [Tepidibacter hydrothermalis]|uniref:HD domain-containing protein n=1 Tax=Tepidibacter hydrothermalis TaxID=3036126 RepID=A0ABY8EHS7_9FIRM|nr:HD domain-containing protein [Tepidibacter hydrothermalis]WFD10318.1 HD domain-containing protein [Tepidibacter hydrothermalis]
MVNKELKKYIEENILPIYHHLDDAHNIHHARDVIKKSMKLSSFFDNIDENLVYAIAAYHDVGLASGDRKKHHIESEIFVRKDNNLKRFFSDEDIDIIAIGCREHRTSSKDTPSSIYSCIVSDADGTDPIDIMIERAYNYADKNYNSEILKNNNEIYEDIYAHLLNKYGKNGYCKYHLKESYKLFNKKEIEDILDDKELFGSIYDEVIR